MPNQAGDKFSALSFWPSHGTPQVSRPLSSPCSFPALSHNPTPHPHTPRLCPCIVRSLDNIWQVQRVKGRYDQSGKPTVGAINASSDSIRLPPGCYWDVLKDAMVTPEQRHVITKHHTIWHWPLASISTFMEIPLTNVLFLLSSVFGTSHRQNHTIPSLIFFSSFSQLIVCLRNGVHWCPSATKQSRINGDFDNLVIVLFTPVSSFLFMSHSHIFCRPFSNFIVHVSVISD